MRKKLLTIITAFAIVLTFAVPSFAAGPSYCAIGDSISVGCKSFNSFFGLPEIDNPGYMDYNKFVNNKKNTNVYAVPHSFVYKVATEIGADKSTSFNGSYVGMRSKDICHILGIPAYRGDSYTFDAFTGTMNLITKNAYKKMFTGHKQMYDNAIKNADVITIELGENDLAAFIINDADDVIAAVTKSLKGTRNSAINLIKFTADFATFSTMVGTNATKAKIDASANTLAKDLDAMQKAGMKMSTLESNLASVMQKRIATDKYYEEAVVKYVREKNPTAKIVVTSEINPYKDMNLGSLGQPIVKLLSDVTMPLINAMDKQILDNAKVYNYKVADISGVNLNPPADKGGAMYMLHPNSEGQNLIKNQILKQLQ